MGLLLALDAVQVCLGAEEKRFARYGRRGPVLPVELVDRQFAICSASLYDNGTALLVGDVYPAVLPENPRQPR